MAIYNNLKKLVFNANSTKSQAEINRIFNSKVKGSITESEYTNIVNSMYRNDGEVNDSEVILHKINQIVEDEEHPEEIVPNTKMTRKDIEILKNKMKKIPKLISFEKFLKILLDFSLMSHEKFLKKFVDLFNSIDQNKDGILDENETIDLVKKLKIVETEDQIHKILAKADPNNNKIVTFSDCVQVFTETEVVIEGEEDGVAKSFTMNVIEKLNNLD